MKEVRDALLRMVRAATKAKAMQEKYLEIGMDDQPWFDIWGEVLDAIYFLIGEHTQTFEESVTYIVMTAPILTDERRVKMLYAEYKKNFPDQPRPHTYEVEELADMYRRSGGYMTPEGDWT